MKNKHRTGAPMKLKLCTKISHNEKTYDGNCRISYAIISTLKKIISIYKLFRLLNPINQEMAK